MSEEYLRWERESAIHPLFLPLEAGMLYMSEYYGMSWPKSTLIYKGNIVLWTSRFQDLYDLGQYIIDKYKEKEEQEYLLGDIEKATNDLEAVFKSIKKAELGELKDNELLMLYNIFKDTYLKWYAILWNTEPVSLQGEQIIKGWTDDKRHIANLTFTTRKTFNKREVEELLGIADDCTEEKLEAHANKYFWLHNNYCRTKVLGTDYFKKELDGLLKEYPDTKKCLGEFEKEREELKEQKKFSIKELSLDEGQIKIVKFVDLIGWLQDYRKEWIMTACHYLDVLLEEFGKRNGLTLEEMKYTVPKDLEDKIDKEEIKKRMENCTITWKEGEPTYKIYTGENALKHEKDLFLDESKTNEVVEIRGMVASQGKVQGKVRVMMSPEEARDMEDGEVLVTSMTSPDFIVAIKKAAAIVTNEGGVACHAAIVSREFGVPCIVGTGIATKVLKTGDFVEVNANHGFVRKLSVSET